MQIMSRRTSFVLAPAMFMLAVLPAAAQDLTWTSEQIGTGIKPAIALDNSDVPHLAFLTEAISGAAFYATNGSGAWISEEIAKGYSYGPVDIDHRRRLDNRHRG